MPHTELIVESTIVRTRAAFTPNLSKKIPIGPASMPIPGSSTPNMVLYLLGFKM